jgi:1,3-beta-glucanosyltransferase GAS5
MVNWDSERQAQTLYFNCRTNVSDVLEEPAWYGLNAYQHCNGAAKTIADLNGWIRLRNDFASFNLSVPVVIAEFGCRTNGFPKIGEFAAQRNWLQIDALYSESYAQVFAGGVVFEYSAEKRQADGSRQQVPWPYYNFAEYQYGIGYFSPIDCDHADTPCQYIPYPEFDLLAQKLAQVDVSSYAETLDEYQPATTVALPECPTFFAPLSDFVWPTDTTLDETCYEVGTEAPTGGPLSVVMNGTTTTTTAAPEPSSLSMAPGGSPSGNTTTTKTKMPQTTTTMDRPTLAPGQSTINTNSTRAPTTSTAVTAPTPISNPTTPPPAPSSSSLSSTATPGSFMVAVLFLPLLRLGRLFLP